MLEDIKIKPLIDTLHLENISDNVYFSEKYADYVSNSRLTLINPDQDGTPEKYFNKEFENTNDSFVLGSAIHGLVLQPESYLMVEEVNRPTAKAGIMADYLYKPGEFPTDEEIKEASFKLDYYKNSMTEKKITDLREKCNEYWIQRTIWESEHEDETRDIIYLDAKSRDRVQSILYSISDYGEFNKLLHPEGIFETPESQNEQTILLDVECTVKDKDPFILRLKSKLDNFTIDKESGIITVNDLKTTSKPVSWFKAALKKYHYNRELGMYSFLLGLCAKKFYDIDKPNIKANFLVVETFEPFTAEVFPVTKGDLVDGINEFKTLLRLVAYYTAYGY